MTESTPSEPGAGAGSFAEDMAALVQREVEQVTRSLREEVGRLRQEAVERAGEAGRGAAMLGAAGGLGLVAAGAVASLPLLGLRRLLPGWAVALLVAGGAGTGAAMLGRAGFAHLQAVAPDAVGERIEQAKEEVSDALKQRARSAAP
jgi:Putative Actinobacterial Holin-X, holin superfamily III